MRLRVGARFLCFLILAAVAPAVFSQSEQRYKELPNFHQINEKLYRGAQPKTGGLQKLKQLRIKTIINLRDDDSRALTEEKEARATGFVYFNVPLARLGRPEEADMRKVLAIINSPDKQPVFVHCRLGADRTGVVIAVYRIVHDGWTSEQAKAEANRYGMKLWEFGTKDYIRDFYNRQREQKGRPGPSQ